MTEDDTDAAAALADFRGTPEQATAALAAKAAAYKAPTTPAPTTPSTAARVRLDALSRSAEFRSQLDAGNPEARKTFADLCAAVAGGDAVADALARGPEMPADHIETTVSGELSSNALRREVEALQSRGVGNDIIKQMVTGSPVSAAEKEAAVRLRSMRMGNSDFVKLYLGGDAAARLEMTLLSTLIAAEVAA